MLRQSELADGIPLPVFFAKGGLKRAIDAYAAASGGTDRRAVVSMWSLYYFAALSIPYLLARQLAGQKLPVAFDTMTLALHENGLPRAFGVTEDEAPPGDAICDHFEAVGPLINGHIGIVIGYLNTGGVSPRLCWNNAAVYIDYALRLAEPDQTRVCEDLSLFTCGHLPDGSNNPLHGCVRRIVEDGGPVVRRKLCCLRYMLPGIPSCGKLCALPSQRSG